VYEIDDEDANDSDEEPLDDLDEVQHTLRHVRDNSEFTVNDRISPAKPVDYKKGQSGASLKAKDKSSSKRKSAPVLTVHTVDYVVYFTFAGLFLIQVVPTVVYLLVGFLVQHDIMDQYLIGLNNSVALFDQLYPTNAYVMESLRFKSTWPSSSRLATMNTAVGKCEELITLISADISTFDTPNPFRELLQNPYSPISPYVPDNLQNVTSDKGFIYQLHLAFKSVYLVTNAGTGSVTSISTELESAYLFYIHVFPKELFLGMENLSFMHYDHFIDRSIRHSGLGQTLHISVVFLVLVVFYFLFGLQEKMREDIKKNCLCTYLCIVLLLEFSILLVHSSKCISRGNIVNLGCRDK
jgi:hypothetical protein